MFLWYKIFFSNKFNLFWAKTLFYKGIMINKLSIRLESSEKITNNLEMLVYTRREPGACTTKNFTAVIYGFS